MNFSTYSVNRKLEKRGLLMPFVATLALLLLFLQSAELSHTHDEFSQQVRCEICLKVGASDDIIAVSSVSISFADVQQSFLPSTLDFIPRLAPLPAKSRAPPQA